MFAVCTTEILANCSKEMKYKQMKKDTFSEKSVDKEFSSKNDKSINQIFLLNKL